MVSDLIILCCLHCEFLIFSECWLLGIIFPQLPPLTFLFFPSWVWSMFYVRQVLRIGVLFLSSSGQMPGGEVFLFFCSSQGPSDIFNDTGAHFFKNSGGTFFHSNHFVLSFTSTWERGTSEIPCWLLRFFLAHRPTSCFRLSDCCGCIKVISNEIISRCSSF